MWAKSGIEFHRLLSVSKEHPYYQLSRRIDRICQSRDLSVVEGSCSHKAMCRLYHLLLGLTR